MAKAFRLVPAEIPQPRAPGAGNFGPSLYSDILKAFANSGERSARVEVPGRRPATVIIGLRQATVRGDSEAVVIQRGSEVYLKRDDEESQLPESAREFMPKPPEPLVSWDWNPDRPDESHKP